MKESVFLRATTALEANSRARNWPASKFTAAELLPEHPVLGALAIDRIDEHRMMLPADFFKAVDATTACGRAFAFFVRNRLVWVRYRGKYKRMPHGGGATIPAVRAVAALIATEDKFLDA